MHLRRPTGPRFVVLSATLAVILAACSDAADDGGLLEPGPTEPTSTEETDGGLSSPSDASTPTPTDASAPSPDAAPVDAGPPGPTYSGKATYYYANGTGACGNALTDSMLVAALNGSQYAKANCGRCVLVKGPLGSVTVKIEDKCPGCAYGDLDLSSTAFKKIAKLADGRVSISWSFVPCP